MAAVDELAEPIEGGARRGWLMPAISRRTSDPGTETAFMQLMRRLADQGRTIVVITHATKNVMLADKVVFLARGGYLAWFGPPDEALRYFDQYR